MDVDRTHIEMILYVLTNVIKALSENFVAIRELIATKKIQNLLSCIKLLNLEFCIINKT